MQTLFKCKNDLTVIIPVYNLERFLEPMLRSLKQQDLGGYAVEFLFVLNNCTDDSEGVIRSSGLECKIINCFIQGCGPARNAGMDIATGEYIWFMDGDDWLLTDNAIRTALSKAKDEGLNILRIRWQSKNYRYNYFSMVWQYLFKREFINEFRFPFYQPSEDDAFTRQVLYKAGSSPQYYLSLPRVEEPLYYYNYLREGSNMYRVNRGEAI